MTTDLLSRMRRVPRGKKAEQSIASYRIASHRIAAHRIASTQCHLVLA